MASDPCLKLVLFIGRTFGCVYPEKWSSIIEIVWIYLIYPWMVIYMMTYEKNCRAVEICDVFIFLLEAAIFQKCNSGLNNLADRIGFEEHFPVIPIVFLLATLPIFHFHVLIRIIPTYCQLVFYLLFLHRLKKRYETVTEITNFDECLSSFVELETSRIAFNDFFNPVINFIIIFLSVKILFAFFLLLSEVGDVILTGLISKFTICPILILAAVQTDDLNKMVKAQYLPTGARKISRFSLKILNPSSGYDPSNMIYFSRIIDFFSNQGRLAIGMSFLTGFFGIITTYFITTIQLTPQLSKDLRPFILNCTLL